MHKRKNLVSKKYIIKIILVFVAQKVRIAIEQGCGKDAHLRGTFCSVVVR